MGSDDTRDARGSTSGRSASRALSRIVPGPGHAATRVLFAAAALTLGFSLLALTGGPFALFIDNVQELVAAGGGAIAVAVEYRSQHEPTRGICRALTIALTGAWLGMALWDLAHFTGSWATVVGNVLFVESAALGAATMVAAMFAGIRPDRLLGIAIDTVIVFLAGAAIVAAMWRADVVEPGDRTASIGAVVLIAACAAFTLSLIARRISLATPGPWALLAGGATLGAAWLLWIGKPTSPSTVDPSDFMFSGALLLIAFGGIRWSEKPAARPLFERIAVVLGALLPAAAILGSIVLLALVQGSAFTDLLGLSTAAVIATAAVRQLYLYWMEARSVAALESRTSELQLAVQALLLEIAERQRLEHEREALQAQMLENQRLEKTAPTRPR